MTAEPKHYMLDDETRAKPIIEEAKAHPVIVEVNGASYEINIRHIASSPYTLESVYASLPPLQGRKGSDISNEELEEMIEAAKGENARNILDGMGAQ